MPELPTVYDIKRILFPRDASKKWEKIEPMEANWFNWFELLSYVNLIF